MPADDPINPRQLQSALTISWQIEPPTEEPDDLEAALHAALVDRLIELLKYDMQTLLSALYRLDVGEHRFEEAMQHESLESIAGSLATAVLDREKQRLRSRQQFQDKPRLSDA